MQNDLLSLLGVKLDEVAKSAFVRSSHEQPKTELIEDRFYMEMPESGLGFIAPLDGTVMTIQLYAEGLDGYKGFVGPLPEGISFPNSRSDVRNKLGQPCDSGGGAATQFFGKAPTWDLYDRDSYSLHIQYADGDETINLITLMRPDSVAQ